MQVVGLFKVGLLCDCSTVVDKKENMFYYILIATERTSYLQGRCTMIMPILNVRDQERSVKFYIDQLGFKYSFSMPGPDGKDNFTIVTMGAATLGLTSEHGEVMLGGSGISLMVYVPDDVDIDAYCAQVKGRGVDLLHEVKTEYWGDRMFVVQDPDGYVISLVKTVKQLTDEEIRAAGSAQGA